jgi:hypothetical protein
VCVLHFVSCFDFSCFVFVSYTFLSRFFSISCLIHSHTYSRLILRLLASFPFSFPIPFFTPQLKPQTRTQGLPRAGVGDDVRLSLGRSIDRSCAPSSSLLLLSISSLGMETSASRSFAFVWLAGWLVLLLDVGRVLSFSRCFYFFVGERTCCLRLDRARSLI